LKPICSRQPRFCGLNSKATFKHEFDGLNYRFTLGAVEYRKMDTQALRNVFLLMGILVAGKMTLTATDVDRAVVGCFVPEATSLKPGGSRRATLRNVF